MKEKLDKFLHIAICVAAGCSALLVTVGAVCLTVLAVHDTLNYLGVAV